MSAQKNTTEITIPAINIQFITLKIVGDTPLIVHKWSEKAKRQILEKQQKKQKQKGTMYVTLLQISSIRFTGLKASL